MPARTLVLMAALAWCASGWLIGVVVQGQETKAPAKSPAEAVLAAAGLHPNGVAWITSEEVRLRKLLADQPELEHRFYKAELGRWEGVYSRLQFLLKEEGTKAVRDVPRTRALDREATRAHEQYQRLANFVRTAPQTLKQFPEVREDELRKRLKLAMDARLALTAAAVEINRHTEEMLLGSYAPLRQRKEIGEALAAMGPTARLGPLKRYDQRQAFERAASEVLTDSFPAYLDGKRYVVAGLVGDRLPASFEFCPEDELTLIPETLAREWGVDLGVATPRVKLTLGDRQLEAWSVKLPKLRFGKYELERVSAVVLPTREAKGEVRLGRAAWEGFDVQVEVDRSEFRLTPKARLSPG